MNKKTLTLGFVGLMGIAIALAYAAGKQSNQLSQEQMSFDQHKVQWEFPKLTTQIWDQVMSHLTTWAKNHESRLQVFADNPNFPNLTEEQTSFMDLTAEKHGNMLNAEMRNGLAQKLTFTVTNHEMRLRALEDKPVVTPPTPSPAGKCVGEYQDWTETNYVGKKVPRSEISCRRFSHSRGVWISVFNEACDNSLIGEENAADHPRSLWRSMGDETFVYVWYQDGTPFIASHRCLSRKWYRDRKIDFDGCRYDCYDNKYKNNSTYCERRESPIMKSCSELNKVACKAKPGCTWQEGNKNTNKSCKISNFQYFKSQMNKGTSSPLLQVKSTAKFLYVGTSQTSNNAPWLFEENWKLLYPEGLWGYKDYITEGEIVDGPYNWYKLVADPYKKNKHPWDVGIRVIYNSSWLYEKVDWMAPHDKALETRPDACRTLPWGWCESLIAGAQCSQN